MPITYPISYPIVYGLTSPFDRLTLTINGSAVPIVLDVPPTIAKRTDDRVGIATVLVNASDVPALQHRQTAIISVTLSGVTSTFFGGEISSIKPDRVGVTRRYSLRIQSWEATLKDKYITYATGDTGVLDTTALAYIGGQVGWDFATHAISQGTVMGDWANRSVFDVLADMASQVGATWNISPDQKGYWYDADTAPSTLMNISETPNFTTTLPCRDISYEEDSSKIVNLVVVAGNGGGNPVAQTLRPRAAGTYQELLEFCPGQTGQHYGQVSELLPDDDLTYMYRLSADYGFLGGTEMACRETYMVTAVDQSARAFNVSKLTLTIRAGANTSTMTSPDPAYFTVFVKSPDGEYYGALQPGTLNSTWQTINQSWTVNPITLKPWTVADIDAMEFGVFYKWDYQSGDAGNGNYRLTWVQVLIEGTDGPLYVTRNDAISQGLYGVRQGRLDNSSLATVAACQSAGDEYLNQNAYPKVVGQMGVDVLAFDIGQKIHITNTLRDIDGDYLIRELTLTLNGTVPATTVSFGDYRPRLQDYLPKLLQPI